MAFHYHHAIVVGTYNWELRKHWAQVFDSIGVKYCQLFLDHLDRVVNRRHRWKYSHGKQGVKRQRAYKQDSIERRLLYVNRTTKYASGIGLDVGSNDTEKKGSNDTEKKVGSRTKRTQYKCGSTTHQTINAGVLKFNKKSLRLTTAKGGEEKEGKKESTSSKTNAACKI